MAAPQIPNLLDTLRNSKSSRAARTKRSGDADGHGQDQIVQRTDDDAAGSRLSAVEAGYLDDVFAKLLSSSQPAQRRMPIINRGTFVRTEALDRLVNEFLALHKGQLVQIISLGAGTDTRFFRLIQRDPSLAQTLRYHEIDFPLTTSKKIKAVQSDPLLFNLLRTTSQSEPHGVATATPVQVSVDEASLTSLSYYVHALDLRDLASEAPPILSNISEAAATLILSECCLTYVSLDASNAILEHLTSGLLKSASPLQIILYEPLHPEDAFGRTMIANLAARGISMPSLEACPTLQAHQERLRNVGFHDKQEGWDIKAIWDSWIERDQKDALRRLEMIDEEEEWNLLAEHYGIIRATRTVKNEA